MPPVLSAIFYSFFLGVIFLLSMQGTGRREKLSLLLVEEKPAAAASFFYFFYCVVDLAWPFFTLWGLKGAFD